MSSLSPDLKHVAIIMDGNNRWAVNKSLPGVAGHQKGVERAREAVEFAVESGLNTLTLFAFSSENWGRSGEEVNLLMRLLNKALQEEVPNLKKNSVQLNFIGDLSRFDKELIDQMKKSEKETECPDATKKLDLVVAASYGGRWDILQAAIKLNLKMQSELINKNPTEEDLSLMLSTGSFSDPDLCIRTGSEFRISNFLLWQLAYSELYFPDILWPDFDSKQFQKALDEFSKRKRRFGDKSNFKSE
jgi:undecaprenyl diphosphate synthase|tara:strand:- start:1543 stop:2277 length:735 start_codon:yes stop_codon:yes gene_type:complete